jgi:hypothetical protein
VKNVVLLLALLLFPLASLASQPDLAKAANDNPFLNGKFNPAYVGQLAGIAGEVIEILDGSKNRTIYKLNLRIKGVETIWATRIAPIPEGPLKIGDMIIFKGYISSSEELDSAVAQKIGDKTLLLALRAERP